MTIDNYCGRNQQGSEAPVSQAETHALIALEQSALYAAQLAIARWINNSADVMPVPDAALPKAAWYAQAHQHFQQWLDHGGFAQYDAACGEQLASLLADDACLGGPLAASTTNSCIE